MDGLSAAASILTVIDITAKVSSLCFQYSVAVKNAKGNVERLQKKIKDIEGVLGHLRWLLERPDNARVPVTHELAATLQGCLGRLQKLEKQLKPGRSRKAMSRLGVQALIWPFKSKEVGEIISELESYQQTFALSLQVDQTSLMLDLDQKIDLAKLPVAKGASFDSHTEEHNAKCLANTRVEIQQQIMEWAKRRDGKYIFWLNGMAGTGKSTIARTVAQSLAGQGRLGATFFFKRGEGDRGGASRLFTTVATDLMTHIPGMGPTIKMAIDLEPTIAEKNLKDQFVKLISEPLSKIRRASVNALDMVVVLDALDECDRDEDIREILRLLPQTKDISPISLRVLVTSRPELPIRLGFQQMSDGTYQDLVLHEVKKETVKRDIALFFEHELAQIGKQRQLDPPWPIEGSIETLVNMAVPLFIFAATVCRFLAEADRSPRARLRDILAYDAEDISKQDLTYLPILNHVVCGQSEKEQGKWSAEFREIVGPIVVLEAPLSVHSLAVLLNLSKEDVRCRLDSLHSVLSIPADEHLPVRLLHLSFRDFLLDPQKRGNSPFWIDESETHVKLATRCLMLMSSPKGIRRNICKLSRPGSPRSEIDWRLRDECLPAEVRYACRYWVSHLQQSQWRTCDDDPVHQFLQKYVLYWLEAMSLIGETPESINMISSLQALVHPKSSARFSAFVRDTKRFALWIRPVLEDTPLQIYSSGLVFAPENSTLRKTFSDCSPKWISRLSKGQEEWSALLQTLEGHSDWVNAVSFSPDGTLVASASRDRTVRLWDIATGFCCSILEGHSNWVNAVSFSPNGTLIASASHDLTVRLWDTATGLCHNILKGHSDWVDAVIFSRDNTLVVSISCDEIVRVWDIATGSCCGTLEGHFYSVHAISFSPESILVASASSDGTVRLWDIATESCRNILKGHLNRVNAVKFSPKGTLVASASHDKTVRLWDIITGSCRSILEGHSDWVNAVSFSPDGTLIASASRDLTVRLWDTATGFCRNILKGHSDWVNAVNVSLDNTLVASASRDKTVRLWDTATGFYRSTLEGHSNQVNVVSFSPDGTLVASASRDKTVRLWDTTTGSCRSILKGHSHWVHDVSFSPDGTLVASISYDKTVRLWDTTMGSCRSILEGHLDLVDAVKFSPDGTLVASTSRDKTVRLWDIITGSCRNIFEGYPHGVNAVSFSPDGKHLDINSGQISFSFTPSERNHDSDKASSQMFVEDRWLSSAGQRLLWLPPEYRPLCKDIYNDVVCLGHASGCVTFLQFNSNALYQHENDIDMETT